MSKKKSLEKSDKKVRVSYPGIKSIVWEHPADRIALKSLKALPGFDTVLRTIVGGTTEKSIRLYTLASSIRVSEKQFGHVHELFMEACAILDMKDIPELFISQNPFLNAGAVGVDKPFVTLNSSMVELMTDDELLYVLGHELGHIKSGHVLYKTLLGMLLQLSTMLVSIPLSALALSSIILALKEWDRKSELSADRAGLLVCQDPDVTTTALMKMAGGSNIKQMDIGEFLKQAEEYQVNESISDSFYKVVNSLMLTHPFPVVRLHEVIGWVRGGDYGRILTGFYKEMEQDFKDDFVDAAKEYGKDFDNTVDPVKGLWDNISGNVKKAKDAFDGWQGENN